MLWFWRLIDDNYRKIVNYAYNSWHASLNFFSNLPYQKFAVSHMKYTISFFFETDFLPVVKKFIKSYLGQKFQVSWQFTHFPSDEISSNLIRNNWGASSIITKKSTASPGAADRTTTMAFDEGKNSLETHQIDLTWWVGSLCKNSLLDCCSWIVQNQKEKWKKN